jgi:hypothetical protein
MTAKNELRHSLESRNLENNLPSKDEIPAFAGMTTFFMIATQSVRRNDGTFCYYDTASSQALQHFLSKRHTLFAEIT